MKELWRRFCEWWSPPPQPALDDDDSWICSVDYETGEVVVPAGPVGEAMRELRAQIDELGQALERERSR